jgi:phosphatidylserine/phosphatidylglycerophosphate/cardiolipin synthase-like enzyme
MLPAFLLGASLERGVGSAEPPCPIGGAAEIHYGPGEDLERIDVALIRSAERQIDMAAYVLTDRAVIEALREASARGVKVRVWRDASEAARLRDYGVEAQLGGRVQNLEIRSNAPGGELMHLKGYCVDGATLRTGSANFSHSGERFQDNDLVVLRGPTVCAGFDAKFERAWARS